MMKTRCNGLPGQAVIAVLICLVWTIGVQAQIRYEPDGAPLPDYYRYHPQQTDRSIETFYRPKDDTLPNIMLTGYWPPTNEMLRRFSPNPDQNPEGWLGDNWEERGYNIYALFPEFPSGLGKGEGDFEVDYQDTSGDWWVYTELLEPIAIISFGRAFNNIQWKLEGGARNQNMNEWIDDYEAPFKPNIGLPIVSEPAGFDRFSSLPIDNIITALSAAGVPVNPVTSIVDSSAFLCNFIGYHACWYHDLHSSSQDPARNLSSGHIHVGYAMSLETAIWATEVTLRSLTDHLNSELCAHSGDVNGDGELTAYDAQLAFLIALGLYSPVPVAFCAADCNGDDDVSAGDAQLIFLAVLGSATCDDPIPIFH